MIPPLSALRSSSPHRRFGDHSLCDVRWAALAIADEAQQGVLARLVELELGDLLRAAVNPGGIGRVLEVERWLGAALPSREGLAHGAQRRAGLIWRRDQVVRFLTGVRELDRVVAGSQPGCPEAVLVGLDLCRPPRQPAPRSEEHTSEL